MFELRWEDREPPREDSVQVLEGHREYVLDLHDRSLDARLEQVPGGVLKRVRPGLWLLNFRNYVGRAEILGVQLEVRSRKIGPAAFETMLADVTAAVSNLPYAFQAPTRLATAPDADATLPVLYQRWVMLRAWMRGSGVTPMETDFLTVQHVPSRRLEREAVVLDAAQVAHASPRGLQDVVSAGASWAQLPPGCGVRRTTFAQRVEARTGKPLFPEQWRTDRTRSIIDTPENRFVRHVLREAQRLNEVFLDRLGRRTDRLNPEIAIEAREMGRQLATWVRSPFFDEVGELGAMPSNSLVLQRREGYRQFFAGYRRLQGAVRYPLKAADLQAMLETKDIATLYELWCFYQVVGAVAAALGPPDADVSAATDDMEVTLANAVRYLWRRERVTVSYNETFKGEIPGRSYSVDLRPDIVVAKGERRLVLDAKFKFDGRDWKDADATAKREDLYKMHTYREAIAGVEAAYALYPGGEELFFQAGDEPALGVGAITCRPGERELPKLREVIEAFTHSPDERACGTSA